LYSGYILVAFRKFWSGEINFVGGALERFLLTTMLSVTSLLWVLKARRGLVDI